MLMSENWLKQDVQIMQFMHRIYGTFSVRSYQQFCTLMVNGNAYNQNSLIELKRLIWSGWQFGRIQLCMPKKYDWR